MIVIFCSASKVIGEKSYSEINLYSYLFSDDVLQFYSFSYLQSKEKVMKMSGTEHQCKIASHTLKPDLKTSKKKQTEEQRRTSDQENH